MKVPVDRSETELIAPRTIGFGEALVFWLKPGFISFGGPAGQIALMHQELVQRRKWISEPRFLHALIYLQKDMVREQAEERRRAIETPLSPEVSRPPRAWESTSRAHSIEHDDLSR